MRMQRYDLRIVRIGQNGKPIRTRLAVLWDNRRVLPPYPKAFCELLTSQMRELARIPARARG